MKANMLEALNHALHLEMQADSKMVVLGMDVGKQGGVFRVTDGLQAKFGTKRVTDTPLSEDGVLSLSLGMAIYGMHPVAEIQFSGFLYEAYHTIKGQMGQYRSRSSGKIALQMLVRSPYGGGVRALDLHSELHESIYVHTAGLKVVLPSNPHDAKGLLLASIRDPNPTLFFEPMKLYRAYRDDIPEESYTVELGKANVARAGRDITLIAYGASLRDCLDVAEQVKGTWDCEVIDLRTLSPLDDETIIASVKKTGRCVVVHEDPRTCGLGAEIAARIMEKAFLHLRAPVRRMTGYDTPFPLYALENTYLPSADKIRWAIEQTMHY
ncbi:MAG: alpha-ketoacid dehydrogenase subunit beta [Nanoarchaeota archaeon]